MHGGIPGGDPVAVAHVRGARTRMRGDGEENGPGGPFRNRSADRLAPPGLLAAASKPTPTFTDEMPDPYERYLADLASADGMPDAPANAEVLQPLPRPDAREPAEEVTLIRAAPPRMRCHA